MIGSSNGTEEPEVTLHQENIAFPPTSLLSYNSSLYESIQESIKYGIPDDNITDTTMTVIQNSTFNETSIFLYNRTHPTGYTFPDVSLLSYDISQEMYPGPYKHVALWEIIIKIITYIPIIVLALIGNFFVILVVARNKRMRTTTNYYIVNLATADLLVVVSCSWVHLLTDLTEGWILGAFFCRFNTFAQGWYSTHVFPLLFSLKS